MYQASVAVSTSSKQVDVHSMASRPELGSRPPKAICDLKIRLATVVLVVDTEDAQKESTEPKRVIVVNGLRVRSDRLGSCSQLHRGLLRALVPRSFAFREFVTCIKYQTKPSTPLNTDEARDKLFGMILATNRLFLWPWTGKSNFRLSVNKGTKNLATMLR